MVAPALPTLLSTTIGTNYGARVDVDTLTIIKPTVIVLSGADCRIYTQQHPTVVVWPIVRGYNWVPTHMIMV